MVGSGAVTVDGGPVDVKGGLTRNTKRGADDHIVDLPDKLPPSTQYRGEASLVDTRG